MSAFRNTMSQHANYICKEESVRIRADSTEHLIGPRIETVLDKTGRLLCLTRRQTGGKTDRESVM